MRVLTIEGMQESIAHYRIGTKLGQGGMGEVYRATDTKLGRDVAIKLIAPALARDATRMASFAREAQMLAALNHPNIASIYGVEDGALVMELVEGPTLADRIKEGPLPLAEALNVARQIAEALAAAHDKGIVHRDLKPANIKITPEGTVKLLDFGLAKAAAVATIVPDEAVTIAMSMVGNSMIVGTPGYMAPEQARGLAVDKRADIWAFGVVLYEMLTGTTLFPGDTITDVMAAVVREQPDLTRVPAVVRPLLSHCLEKDQRRRLRDIGDAMLLIETASTASTSAAVPGRARSGGGWVPWTVAAVLLAGLVALAVTHLRETAPVPEVVRFRLSLPEGLTFTQNGPFAVSPDGRRLAFPAVGADGVARIWVHEFAQTDSKPLGAEIAGNAQTVAWSPDSRYVLYVHDQKLKRIDAVGGQPQAIVDLQGPLFGVTWHPNGSILYGTVNGVMRVSASGGAVVPVTRMAGTRGELHAVLGSLPGTDRFLYTRGGMPGARAIYTRSIDDAADAPDGEPLLLNDTGASFVPLPGAPGQGHLLFLEDGTLVAQRFDTGDLKLTGDPTPVAEQVFGLAGNGAGFAYYSASDQGTIVYRTGTIAGLARQLAWFDRSGTMLGTIGERARYQQMKISPDGTRLAASRTDFNMGSNSDIWITDLAAGTSTRFTFDDEPDAQPSWSPDGRFIAWAGVRDGKAGIYRKSSDGAGNDELLYEFPQNPGALIVSDWSSDGRSLVLAMGGDIFALPIGPGTSASSRKPVPVIQTPAREFGPDLSPDGRWIVYISDETGRQELYVQPFAPGVENAAAGTPVAGKWMVSSTGTLGLARWRGDGKELLSVNADGMLTAVDVTAAPVFRASAPRPLFQFPRPFLVQTGTPGTLADITQDGQRLLLALPSEESTRPELSVVLNWQRAASP